MQALFSFGDRIFHLTWFAFFLSTRRGLPAFWATQWIRSHKPAQFLGSDAVGFKVARLARIADLSAGSEQHSLLELVSRGSDLLLPT